MPIQIRKYNVKKLSSEIQAENDKIEAERNKKNNSLSMAEMATGDVSKFKPDFISKAPTKK